MNTSKTAPLVAALLQEYEFRVVFAESCTAGLVCASLSSVPGISQWLCGSAVTYRNATKSGWLDVNAQDLKDPGAVSETVAQQMAVGVLRRTPEADFALSITGHLGPGAPPELDGRVYVGTARRGPGGLATPIDVAMWTLSKTSRVARQQEAAEEVLSLLQEQLEVEAESLERILPGEDWRALHEEGLDAVCLGEAAEQDERYTSGLIFPGAFNPLHEGHRQIAEIAEDLTGEQVEFELSLVNVDKPPLRRCETARRAAPLLALGPVWITRAPTFAEKALLFPRATFVVGADTMARIGDPRYYRDDLSQRDDCVASLAEQDCRFLFFGRTVAGTFRTLESLDLPAALVALCDEVPSDRFRADISSTDLRDRRNNSS